MNNLKARLQRAGTPRRESPGVGAGAEGQVTKFDDSTSVIPVFDPIDLPICYFLPSLLHYFLLK